MRNGILLIADERQRQINEERWTFEHDDKHNDGSLAMAASCYAQMASLIIQGEYFDEASETCAAEWPWEMDWWKPSKEPTRNLVKAGSLIAAEIDRLQRLFA